MSRRPSVVLGLFLAACASRGARPTSAGGGAIDAAAVRAVEYPLADDSMEGRNTGRPGSMKATRFIAASA